MIITRINRHCRSFLTLNRDCGFAILKEMLALKKTNNMVLDEGSGDRFWTASIAKHSAHITGETGIIYLWTWLQIPEE